MATPDYQMEDEASIRAIKSCRICSDNKPLTAFVKSKAFKSGYDTICLDCSRQKVKEWRAQGKRDSAAEARRYYQRNPGKNIAKSVAYQQRKRKACPLWVDLKAIEEIYMGCPTGHDVDHIVPLQGETVCGLHVPWNLQYLPASINRAKRNKFDG